MFSSGSDAALGITWEVSSTVAQSTDGPVQIGANIGIGGRISRDFEFVIGSIDTGESVSLNYTVHAFVAGITIIVPNESTNNWDGFGFSINFGPGLELSAVPSISQDIPIVVWDSPGGEREVAVGVGSGGGAWCFPAQTSITIADGTSIPIADIRIGDEVLSFKPDGSLVSGTVTQLLENVTTEWVKLTRADDHDFELVATPGHHFLRPDGSFAAIADIIADDGRIVHVDGSVITVEAERIAYSTDTAHLYEQHAMRKMWTSGGLAMAPEHIEGWRTYNFERRAA